MTTEAEVRENLCSSVLGAPESDERGAIRALHPSVVGSTTTVLLNVTVPVLNEAAWLVPNIRQLASFLARLPGISSEMLIADNGSTDATLCLAHSLARELPNVRVLRLEERGRGRALKAAWQSSLADILSYMDVDLSTDLNVIPTMLDSLLSGQCDLAIASRLLNPESTSRSLKRELISRVYAATVRALFAARFSDPQCGFKFMRREAFESLLPLVRDDAWFFDTELLVLAERTGWRISDFPAAWVERKETRVKLLPTILGDLRGLISLRRRLRRMAGP
jgi:glycosyltransferase involved in cell wall biosynthesis